MARQQPCLRAHDSAFLARQNRKPCPGPPNPPRASRCWQQNVRQSLRLRLPQPRQNGSSYSRLLPSRFREAKKSCGRRQAHVCVATNNVAVTRAKPRCPLQGHRCGGPPYLQAQIVPLRLLAGHLPDERTLRAACAQARGEGNSTGNEE